MAKTTKKPERAENPTGGDEPTPETLTREQIADLARKGADGWDVVSTDKNWVVAYEGLVVRGKMVGVETRESTQREGETVTDVQIQLTHPCVWDRTNPTTRKTEEITAVPGDVVTVGVTATLKKLPNVPIGDLVMIEWTEKVSIGNGQTVWRTTVRHKASQRQGQALGAGAPMRHLNPADVMAVMTSMLAGGVGGRALPSTIDVSPRRGDDDIPF